MSYPEWAFTLEELQWISRRFWLAVDWAYLIMTAPVLLTVRWVMVAEGRHRA